MIYIRMLSSHWKRALGTVEIMWDLGHKCNEFPFWWAEKATGMNNIQGVILHSIPHKGCGDIHPFQRLPEAGKMQKLKFSKDYWLLKEAVIQYIQYCNHPLFHQPTSQYSM